MPVPPQEAAGALHDIEHAQRRSAIAYGYQKRSPHLILWGVIWIVGYALVYARPQWGATWLVLAPAGFLASFWIGRRTRAETSRTFGWRYAATIIVILLFITALFAIMPPTKGAQAAAFFPLLVAVFYAVFGIWRDAARMAVLGLAVGALTVAGYFLLSPQFFMLWMAGVGGGALILGGFWMRGV
jgi:hypothetical protein